MINKKQFLGGINTDVTESLIDPKDYIGAMNVRIATSENGLVGNVSNVEGNRALTSTLGIGGAAATFAPTGDSTIGTYEDVPNRRIIFFNYSTTNDGIYCYDADTDLIYTVLKSSQVNPGLNFQKDKFIHSVSMVGHMIYWTDDYNEPRRVNIESGIKMNHPSYVTEERPYVLDSYGYIDYSVITIIRKPPALPLIIEKSTDETYLNNFIKDEAFQFFYRFGYKDGEHSVFSPKSILAGYNSVKDKYNQVNITIPAEQLVDFDIDTVEVGAIYATGNKAYIVKTWKRTTDLTAINNHNNNVTTLSFVFKNDVIGYNIPDTESAKAYDSVPIKSAALEIAKERLFLGNNISGYASPTSTSLAIDLTTATLENVTNEVYATIVDLRWRERIASVVGPSRCLGLLYIENTGDNSDGYYTYDNSGSDRFTKYPAKASYNFSELTFVGKTQQAVRDKLDIKVKTISIPNLLCGVVLFFLCAPITIHVGNASDVWWDYNPKGLPTTPGKLVIDMATSDPADQFSANSFKSDSTYKVGIVFKDYANRPCGVITNSLLMVTTPDRKFSTLSNTSKLNWKLTDSLSQIPEWAYSYSILRSKSLRANSFIQLRADKLLYVNRNSDTGEYEIKEDKTPTTSTSTYDKTYFGVAIKATSLYSNSLGYAYQEGDLVKIYKGAQSNNILSDGPYVLKVKDTFSDYIIVELYNFGTIDNFANAFLFEIYTPTQESLSEVYYEVGQAFEILHPGTLKREYSVKGGYIRGDVRFVYRKSQNENYVAEAMSPNDKYFKNWFTDIGRPYIEIDAIVKRKKTEIAFSNVILPGTKTNGLSSFEVLNFMNVPLELSSIQRLKLTSKVQSEGTVMIVVGEQETASAYLGEGQIFDASGASFLAKSVNVIGQINVLKGGYGTLHPESVSEWKGAVFFFDARKGAVVQYDSNGLLPISDNGMKKYFRKLGQDYNAYLKNNANYNNANILPLRVQSITDPYHEEMVIQAPRMNANVSNEHLLDMVISTQSVSVNTVIQGGFTATATAPVQGGFTATATYSCALVVTLDTTAPTTLGNDGTTTANVTGGTTNYTYLWSNGATTKTISGLLSGSTYSVTVTDIVSACTGTSSVSFPLLATVSFYAKPYDRSTDSSHTIGYFLKQGIKIDGTHYFSGSFYANPPVGTNGSGNFTLTPLTIKKLAGSTLGIQSNFFIDNPVSEPYPNTWTAGGVTAVSADLVLQIKKDGVLIGAPIVTTIYPSSPVTTINLSETMVAGSVYEVYGYIENLVLPVAVCALVVTLDTTAPTTLGNDGSTTVNVSGGTGNYTYLWSNGATTNTITGLLSGSSYSVTVTDTVSACTASESVSFPLLATVNFYNEPYGKSFNSAHTFGYFLSHGIKIDTDHYFSYNFYANPPAGTHGTGNFTLTPLTIKKLAGSTLGIQSNFFIDTPGYYLNPINYWTAGGITAVSAELILQVKKDGVLIGAPMVTTIVPSSGTTTINLGVTMVAGSVYEVYGRIDNLVLPAAGLSLGYSAVAPSNACTATHVNYYSSCSPLAMYCTLYTDSAHTTYAPQGYYSDGITSWYNSGSHTGITDITACPTA